MNPGDRWETSSQGDWTLLGTWPRMAIRDYRLRGGVVRKYVWARMSWGKPNRLSLGGLDGRRPVQSAPRPVLLPVHGWGLLSSWGAAIMSGL